MAEQSQNALTSAFPSPPPFYIHFTSTHLSHLASLQKTHQSTQEPSISTSEDSTTAAPIIPNLPSELRYLQPPPPPENGVYRCFGDVFNLNDTLPTLTEQGITQLYTPTPSPSSSPTPSTSPSVSQIPHTSKSLILKRLAKSLLLNFLELIGILSTNPEQYTDKLSDLRTLFINLHHLLNEYRPHQAREQVILLMEQEVSRVRAEREGIEGLKVRVDSLLANLGKGEGGAVQVVARGEGREEYERAVWGELEREFGGRRESGAGYFEDETCWVHDRGWAGGQYPHA